jgi:hypothetical protein
MIPLLRHIFTPIIKVHYLDMLRILSGLQAGLGASPAFRVPEYQLQSTFELPLVLVLGALCGVVAAAFRVSSQASHLLLPAVE